MSSENSVIALEGVELLTSISSTVVVPYSMNLGAPTTYAIPFEATDVPKLSVSLDNFVNGLPSPSYTYTFLPTGSPTINVVSVAETDAPKLFEV